MDSGGEIFSYVLFCSFLFLSVLFKGLCKLKCKIEDADDDEEEEHSVPTASRIGRGACDSLG